MVAVAASRTKADNTNFLANFCLDNGVSTSESIVEDHKFNRIEMLANPGNGTRE
jgi:hypothetical protein